MRDIKFKSIFIYKNLYINVKNKNNLVILFETEEVYTFNSTKLIEKIIDINVHLFITSSDSN